jgi:hypothetical protein
MNKDNILDIIILILLGYIIYRLQPLGKMGTVVDEIQNKLIASGLLK